MPDVIGTLFHKEIPYGGVKGDKGDTGATPNVSATASVDSSTGTPSVNVVKTGTAENPSFEFAFSNLKGEKGDPGSGSTVSWGEIDGDIADQTDLMDELDDKTDNSVVGTVENGATASKPYDIGQHFIKDGYFCTAIAVIAQGATLTLNTNYTQGDVAGAIDTNILENVPEQRTLNDDLNNYKSGGIYRWSTNAIIATVANKPSDVTYSFFLVVMPYNQDYVIQKLFIDNNVYSRRYYAFGASPWSHWFKFTGTDTGS